MEQIHVKENTHSGLVSSTPWLKSTGRSRTTLWRWRKASFIETVTIAGRLYLTKEQMDAFERRAIAGELTKFPRSGTRNNGKAGSGNMPQCLAVARGLASPSSVDTSSTPGELKEGC